jgi:hypothetical protein
MCASFRKDTPTAALHRPPTDDSVDASADARERPTRIDEDAALIRLESEHESPR